MVQVDVFWSFAVGAGFAAVSPGLLEKEEKPLESRPFVKALLWLSVFFAPSGACLLWMYPDWETMQVGTWESVPGWLVAGFAMTNVTQGILGFWLGSWLIRQRKVYEANLLPVAGYFGMFFILVHGWDGSGYDRFFYSPMRWGGEVVPWQPGNFGILDMPAFMISPVGVTLLIMGAVMFPFFFRWMEQMARASKKAAKENQSTIYDGLRRNPAFLRVIGIYSLGGAVVASLCIRLLGPWIGTPVFVAALWFLCVRKGGFLHREYVVPAGKAGAMVSGGGEGSQPAEAHPEGTKGET